MEHVPIEQSETALMEDAKQAEVELRRHLHSHRLTHKELVRALMALGVSAEWTTRGSGHKVLRYGERNAAIASKNRKNTEKWQPHSVMRTIKHLQIPVRDFLAVIKGDTKHSTYPHQQSIDPNKGDWLVDETRPKKE